MTVWHQPQECGLCGVKGQPIHVRLVEWRIAPPGMTYAHVARCDDRTACRLRVEAKGEQWPVREKAA